VKIEFVAEDFRRRENPSCRLHNGEMIAHDSGGVVETGLNIFTRKARVLFENIFDRITCGKKFQNRLHRDPRAANNGPTIANVRVDGDSI
jgi:hypothetical protein